MTPEGRSWSDAEVIVHDGTRVSFILNNREFEVVVAPILVEGMGAEAAAEATAGTLRYALGLTDDASRCPVDPNRLYGPCTPGCPDRCSGHPDHQPSSDDASTTPLPDDADLAHQAVRQWADEDSVSDDARETSHDWVEGEWGDACARCGVNLPDHVSEARS